MNDLMDSLIKVDLISGFSMIFSADFKIFCILISDLHTISFFFFLNVENVGKSLILHIKN